MDEFTLYAIVDGEDEYCSEGTHEECMVLAKFLNQHPDNISPLLLPYAGCSFRIVRN